MGSSIQKFNLHVAQCIGISGKIAKPLTQSPDEHGPSKSKQDADHDIEGSHFADGGLAVIIGTIAHSSTPSPSLMEIAIIVILFIVGTVGGAMQALKYVERRRRDADNEDKRDDPSSPDH